MAAYAGMVRLYQRNLDLHEGPIGVFDDIASYQDYDDLAETRTGRRRAEDLTFDGTQGGWIGFRINMTA